jgi:hypothetical protein
MTTFDNIACLHSACIGYGNEPQRGCARERWALVSIRLSDVSVGVAPLLYSQPVRVIRRRQSLR